MTTEFIAEIGSNWRVGNDTQSKNRALELIELAARSGADTVKFQLIKANKLYKDKKKVESLIPYELPINWLPELKEQCSAHNVKFLCTPFYLEAVDYLEDLGVEEYKIASWDINYKPLLEKVGRTGKYVILSTGASTFEEVADALDILRPNEQENIALLHCTGGYPTLPQHMNLRRMLDLASEFFPIRIGLSSHCTNPYIVASSVLYQADIIEFHFDGEDRQGIEAGHSLTPSSAKAMITLAKEMKQAIDCGCSFTEDDKLARNIYRRKEDNWLR